MSLCSLVYVSLAVRKMTDTDLSELLATSRKNNAKQEITGLLLYRDGFFIQALEGEESVIDALFKKIRKDQRHSDVLLLFKEPIDERSFAEWSMGFKLFDSSLRGSLEDFSDFLTHPAPDFFARNPGKAKSLLYNFRTRHPLTDIGPGSMDASSAALFELSHGMCNVMPVSFS